MVTTLPSRCLAKQHELLIDRLAGKLRQLAVVDHQVDLRIAAQPVEDVEPAAAAVAAQLVARIGDRLQLGDHELRHDRAGCRSTRVSTTSAIRPSITTLVSSTYGLSPLTSLANST